MADAGELLEAVKDGSSCTDNEKATIKYIRENYIRLMLLISGSARKLENGLQLNNLQVTLKGGSFRFFLEQLLFLRPAIRSKHIRRTSRKDSQPIRDLIYPNLTSHLYSVKDTAQECSL